MNVREAWSTLGLPPTATLAQARAAYRHLLRTYHPDVAGATGARTTVRVIDAWRVLRTHVPATAPVDVDDDGETITLDAPPDEAFLVLLDAAHRVGDVTHVGPDDGLLEALVTFDDGRTCSLVVSLQGRGDGMTEAFCTIQALDAGPNPPVGGVVTALMEEVSVSIRARRAGG